MQIQPNALIQTDALALLERIDGLQVNLVYLDPPHFGAAGAPEPLREYLRYISKVLQQCERILSDKGTLFFHTRHSQSTDIRLLLDQTFGRHRFCGEFIVPYTAFPLFDAPSKGHATILRYSKGDKFTYNRQLRPMTADELDQSFPLSDERGRYRLVSLTRQYSQVLMHFEWRGYTPRTGQAWRFSRNRLENLHRQGLIHQPHPSNEPRLKQYTDGLKEVDTQWTDVPERPPWITRARAYPGQQPIQLLTRIVQLGSNPGDLILDPYCGSGTALVAAQTASRAWIGADCSPEAIEKCIGRLRAVGARLGRDFAPVHQSEIEAAYERQAFYYAPLVLPEDLSVKPLVITEGKTDWKHLKAAYLRLQAQGHFRHFEIEFREFEEEIKMGSPELLALVRQLAKIPPFRKIIAIFDRDEKDKLREITDADRSFKHWGNNVYSFAIPVPDHRHEDDRICIEMYYTDEEIRRTDAEGHRLFHSSEFNARTGRHNALKNLHMTNIGRLQSPKIIDSDVFNEDDQNVALPKSDFAQYVLDGRVGFRDFDVSQFAKIFDIIVDIALE